MSLDKLNNLIKEASNKKCFYKPNEISGDLTENFEKESGIVHNKFIEYYSFLEKTNRFEVVAKPKFDLEEKIEETIKLAAEDVLIMNGIPLNDIHSKIQIIESKTIQIPTKFRIIREIDD